MAIESSLEHRISALENAIQTNDSKLLRLGEITRNNIGTITAMMVAVFLNIAVSLLHFEYKIPLYTQLIELERIVAIDSGMRLREFFDAELDRSVALPRVTRGADL